MRSGGPGTETNQDASSWVTEHGTPPAPEGESEGFTARGTEPTQFLSQTDSVTGGVDPSPIMHMVDPLSAFPPP